MNLRSQILNLVMSLLLAKIYLQARLKVGHAIVFQIFLMCRAPDY